MADRINTTPPAPPCPVCTGAMTLRRIHRKQPVDHMIYKCGDCALEYPVVSGEAASGKND